ncbi:hypothetical protein [Bradyrhizobium sp. CB3481]|uniref:hypothetical protein n=1 Tax=Bradyrhizobium sp. CB3481 TaxID=3039158 RepID=UPI0024B05B97|nr:hypothetical protein [Bradyrhizobium sp. CB3481]WFU14650.1 hypothetical protein QA643_26655 [Bradyrhizobium sp. CB3481]
MVRSTRSSSNAWLAVLKALAAEARSCQCLRRSFSSTRGHGRRYEKIQLFRIFNIEHDDDVIRKFINESYHIENEYVMQLNPHKFESIPEYIIDEAFACCRPSNRL